MFYKILAVFIGGGLGSVARYGLSHWIHSFSFTTFPYGTLAVNISSCLILGIVVSQFGDREMMNFNLRFIAVIGFCGGFSTFSAFSFETLEFIRSGNFLFALTNIAVNVIACLAAVAGGMMIFRSN